MVYSGTLGATHKLRNELLLDGKFGSNVMQRYKKNRMLVVIDII